MVVVCNNESCQYLSGNGFCRRRVVSIVNGGCSYVRKPVVEEPVYYDKYVPSYMEQKRDKELEKLTGMFALIAEQKKGK